MFEYYGDVHVRILPRGATGIETLMINAKKPYSKHRTKAPFTHSRFLATVPLRFATICKIVVYRGVPWTFVVEPK